MAAVLLDPLTERAFAAALIAEPDLFAMLPPEFGIDVIGDLQARSVYAAIANLLDRGSTPDRDSVRAEIAINAGHDDLPWYDRLVVEPRPLNLVMGWARTILMFAGRRAAAVMEDTESERIENEISEMALRDVEGFDTPVVSIEEHRARRDAVPPPLPKPWRRCPDLVDAIMERAADPWVDLTLGAESICRVRAGGTAVLIGGSGSGKSSLTSCLLVEHARNVGPAIALSIELPAEELAARIVGIRCDASWEDSLCGRVPREHMVDALAVPRLYVLDRRRATLKNLEACIDAARAEYPGQPVLVGFDYTQLLDSKEREARLRVADSFAQIDECAREKRFVALALSQMSRFAAQQARSGDKIGAEAADLGAESAAIERFATVTLTIGMKGEPREDGSEPVELSIGKARMGQGDRVVPMRYWGRTGLWRVAGDAQTATAVREERDQERTRKERQALELALVAAAHEAAAPVTRAQLLDSVAGIKTRKATKTAALAALLSAKRIVEIDRRQLRSKYWMVWHPDRVNSTPGIQVREHTYSGDA